MNEKPNPQPSEPKLSFYKPAHVETNVYHVYIGKHVTKDNKVEQAQEKPKQVRSKL